MSDDDRQSISNVNTQRPPSNENSALPTVHESKEDDANNHVDSTKPLNDEAMPVDYHQPTSIEATAAPNVHVRKEAVLAPESDHAVDDPNNTTANIPNRDESMTKCSVCQVPVESKELENHLATSHDMVMEKKQEYIEKVKGKEEPTSHEDFSVTC